MFKSLKNIQGAFALIRIYFILITVIAISLGAYAIYESYKFAEMQREKIYVLDGGKSLLMALSHDVQQNRLAEARSHVKRFHEHFFTISPDKEAIEHHIEYALALAGKEAIEKYQLMKEEGFYDRIIAAGINCEIRVDSVLIDESTYPFKARLFGKTSVIRSSNITYRNLETECELINCSRSDNNPHGFMIEKWRIIDNSDINVINR